MKTTYPFTLLVLVVLLAGCTTVYRTGQTPDDVYYSPARPEDEYLVMQRQEHDDIALLKKIMKTGISE